MRRLLSALVLACLPLGVCAQNGKPPEGPSETAPRPSEPGSPIAITDVRRYTEQVSQNGTVISRTPRLCVSFENLSGKPLRAVTIELAHRRIDGTVSELALLKRQGPFSRNVEIRGADCPEFSAIVPGVSEAVRTDVRPIAAEFADGSTWRSIRPPAVLASAAPVVDPGPPPAWDGTHHAGYLAIESGGGTLRRPEPYFIRLYAPGYHQPSATLTFPKCCPTALGFDGAGDLLVATMGLHAGLLVYAPGAQEPTKRLPVHDGSSLAADEAGDLAIGGPSSDPDIEVYPHNGRPYRIKGQPVVDGLAFAPNGELAVSDLSSRRVRTYPRGAKSPAREFSTEPENSIGRPRRVVYDSAGDLAVQTTDGIAVFEPGKEEPSYTIPTRRFAHMTYDGADRLIVLDADGTSVYTAHAATLSKRYRHVGLRAAADRAGRIAVSDPPRSTVTIVETDGTESVIWIPSRPTDVAFSP